MQDNSETDPEQLMALHRSPRAVNLRVAHAESLGVAASSVGAVQGHNAAGMGGSGGSVSSDTIAASTNQPTTEVLLPGDIRMTEEIQSRLDRFGDQLL